MYRRCTEVWRHPGRALVLVLGLALSGDPAAARDALPEYQVKAAFLYNFTRFIEWPDPPQGGHFDLCVVGHDPFGELLDETLAGKHAQGRPLRIRRLASPAELDTACRIAFIDPALAASASDQALRWPGLLTLSETYEVACRAVMICFHLKATRVRFDIDLGLTRELGLMVSSRLLRVARRIRD